MAFIPYEHLELQTSLTLAEAVARISSVVEPRKLFRNPFGGEHAEFQGEVAPDGFKISRIIHYRNSFLPIIKGRIEPLPLGTRIAIKMTLHPFVLVFGIFWLVMVGLASLTFAVSAIASRQFDPAMLIPVGMLVFGYLLFTLSFKWESRKARARLTKLFAEQTLSPTSSLNRFS